MERNEQMDDEFWMEVPKGTADTRSWAVMVGAIGRQMESKIEWILTSWTQEGIDLAKDTVRNAGLDEHGCQMGKTVKDFDDNAGENFFHVRLQATPDRMFPILGKMEKEFPETGQEGYRLAGEPWREGVSNA